MTNLTEQQAKALATFYDLSWSVACFYFEDAPEDVPEHRIETANHLVLGAARDLFAAFPFLQLRKELSDDPS